MTQIELTMKNIILIGIILFLSACTADTARLSPDLLESQPYGYSLPISASFQVSPGDHRSKFPKTWTFHQTITAQGGPRIKIDLKEIQDVAALSILNRIYSNLGESRYDLNIVSWLYNASYRKTTDSDNKPHISVSFDLDLIARDRIGNTIYGKTISVKDALGDIPKELTTALDSRPQGLTGASFWPAIQDDLNAMSQYVNEIFLEKVHEIYVAEFAEISRIYTSFQEK